MLATLLVCVALDLNVVQVQALAGDIHCVVFLGNILYSRLTVPLSTQVYKWVPTNLMLGGNPAMDKHPIQGEYRTGISLGLMGHLAHMQTLTTSLTKRAVGMQNLS